MPRRFPSPEDQLDPRRYSEEEREYSYRLNAWMCSRGHLLIYKFIRESGNDPTARPAVEWMASRLDDLTVELGRRWIASAYDYDGHVPDGVIEWESVHTMATSAAEFALREYDPRKRERRAHGGSRSRRGPSYTLDMLRALPSGLTATQQAVELGCSIRTIRSLRAQL
jgi:hypothetical protein